jgi:ribosomal protein L35
VPKQKTHKDRQAGTSHLQVRLTAKRRRSLRGTRVLAPVDTAKIAEALGPYSY